MAELLSIIIPTFNAQSTLGACLQAVREYLPQAEVIVVDGGSQDGTVSVARTYLARVVHSARGRGPQCNAGASQASREVFLFLHADTLVTASVQEALQQFLSESQQQIGTFKMIFDEPNWLLRFYSTMTRFDSIFTKFGDQGIVVRRNFFNSLGGFPNWPLFEDVHLLRGARVQTRIHSLAAVVKTSAVRFRANGFLRQQVFNFFLILRYLRGESPFVLAQCYENFSRKGKYATAHC